MGRLIRLSGWLCCVLLLILHSTAGADDETTDVVADKVIAAFEAGDAEALEALAKGTRPDPWLVADQLCLRDAHDAAMAYARAAVGQDTARLPAYLEERADNGVDEDLRAALDLAMAARDQAGHAEALLALDAVRGHGDIIERAMVELSRARAFGATGRNAEASEAYVAAGRAAERAGWLGLAAHAFQNAGMQAHQDGDLDSMLATWTRLRDIEQARDNQVGVGRTLVYLGNVQAELGNYDRSVELLVRADGVFTEERDASRRAWALDNLGHVLLRRGEYSRAQDVLERALALAQEVKYRHREAQILSNLGSLHTQISDFTRALELHEQALEIFDSRNDAAGIAGCVGNIGRAYGRMGELARASIYLQKALDAFRNLEDTKQIVVGLINLGDVQLTQGLLAKAKISLDEAVALAAEAGDDYRLVYALQNLAEVQIQLEEFAAAKKVLDRSSTIATRLASPRILTDTYTRQAQLFNAQQQYDRAVHAAERGIAQTLVQLVGLAPDQAAIARESLAMLFEASLQAAVGTGRPERVFSAIESARAGALLESLENRDAIRKEYVPDDLRKTELAANLAVKAAARALQKAVASGDRRETKRALRALAEERDGLEKAIARIQRVARAGARVLYPEIATLDDAKDLLQASDALVSYSLLTDPAVALVVTAKRAWTVDLGSRDALVEAAGAKLDDPKRDVTADVKRLEALLIEPLKLTPEVRRVLVSPDGILGYLPFSLLVGGRDVALVPSATAYDVLRSQKGGGGKGVLALGDPDYRLDTEATPEAWNRAGVRFTPIPATRKEAKDVGDVVLLGAEATTGRFLMKVKTRARWRAIHLACHGLVDTVRPMRSALALAADKGSAGLLTCAMVYSQKLAADLAVLSACETGKGKVYRVEGISGLTQGFMVAGCPRVLVSLWNVDDDATRALMGAFYKRWKGGRVGAAEALRKAQAEVRANEQWRHPYYWAGWALWGLAD